jgi:hypothetical protein
MGCGGAHLREDLEAFLLSPYRNVDGTNVEKYLILLHKYEALREVVVYVLACACKL